MTTPAARTPLAAPRPTGPGGGLSPHLPKPKRRWALYLITGPALLLGLTYFLGRTVEPIQLRLAMLPVVGKPLFGAPVWKVLWNKPATPDKPAAGESPPGTTTSGTAMQEALLAQRTAELVKLEADLAQREAALKQREGELAELERRLNEQLKVSETIKVQLEGQLRSEKDRAEVIRQMRSSSAVQVLNAMTDDEVVRILRHMTASEVGSLLNGMDPTRAARILQRLTSATP